MSASERLLRLAEVEERVAHKKSWVYAEMDAGRFPEPDDGRWYLSEINRYLRIRRMAGNLVGIWPARRFRAA